MKFGLDGLVRIGDWRQAERSAFFVESAAIDKSIAFIAERWLQIGAAEMHHKEIDDPLRALSYLQSIIEDQTRYVNEDDKYCTWRTDAFAFEAFRTATNMLFDRLKPPGEAKPQKEIDGVPTERTVAQHAEFAFSVMWRGLQNSAPRSKAEVDAALRAAYPGRKTPYPDRNLGMISDASYRDERARRALGIQAKSAAKGESK